MSIREWLCKNFDLVPAEEYDKLGKIVDERISILQERVEVEHKAAVNIAREDNEVIDRLNEEVFETNERYGRLLKIVRECINKKKYKAIKDYLAAYDNGEMYLWSDNIKAEEKTVTSEIDVPDGMEIDDDELNELLEEIDKQW